MAKDRILFTCIVIFSIIVSIGLMLYQQVMSQCEQRLNTQSIIDVPVDAEIVSTSTSRTGENYIFIMAVLGAEHYTTTETNYVTQIDYKEVVAFYEKYGECHT